MVFVPKHCYFVPDLLNVVYLRLLKKEGIFFEVDSILQRNFSVVIEVERNNAISDAKRNYTTMRPAIRCAATCWPNRQ